MEQVGEPFWFIDLVKSSGNPDVQDSKIFFGHISSYWSAPTNHPVLPLAPAPTPHHIIVDDVDVARLRK